MCLKTAYRGLHWVIIKPGFEYCAKDSPPYEGEQVLGSVPEECKGPFECLEPLYVWDTNGSGISWGRRRGQCQECGCTPKHFGNGLFLACPQWAKKSATWIMLNPTKSRKAGKHRVYCVRCSKPSEDLFGMNMICVFDLIGCSQLEIRDARKKMDKIVLNMAKEKWDAKDDGSPPLKRQKIVE